MCKGNNFAHWGSAARGSDSHEDNAAATLARGHWLPLRRRLLKGYVDFNYNLPSLPLMVHPLELNKKMLIKTTSPHGSYRPLALRILTTLKVISLKVVMFSSIDVFKIFKILFWVLVPHWLVKFCIAPYKLSLPPTSCILRELSPM